MIKIYRSKTGVKYNLLLEKKSKVQVQIEFRGSNKEYITGDEETQALLESCRYFKEGKIGLYRKMESAKKDAIVQSEVVYASPSELQDAIDVLVSEYNVDPGTLVKPNDVKKAAEKVNAVFPNVVYK